MSISERIKIIRGNLRQKDFADRIGTSQSTVQTWEEGRSVPGGKLLEAIYRQFQINILWLLTGEGDPYISSPSQESPAAAPPPAQPGQVQPTDITQSVSKLMHILGSGNQTFIRAIESNLDAFSEAVEQKDRIRHLEDQVSSLSSKLNDLESKLTALEHRSSPGETPDVATNAEPEKKAG